MNIPVIAQRYDSNARNKEGKMKTGTKIIIGAVIAFILVVLGAIGFLMSQSSKPAEFTISDGNLKISGLYGETIRIADMKSLSLLNDMPEILTRTNGSGLGTMLKGNFELKDYGAAKLFVDTSKLRFIIFQTDSAIFIINRETPALTENLFNQLLSIWKGN
jgi:hypothetical protein